MSLFSFLKREPTRHRELVRDGALLLDVRSPEEFAARHLPGAKNVPVDQLADRLSELGPTSRPIVVHCRSGARSARATAVLRAAGYQVTDFGGIDNW
ncbi:MAG: rhodanese-like domain-containing protein [Polyangiales bacterium]